jgi:hypothetical protein
MVITQYINNLFVKGILQKTKQKKLVKEKTVPGIFASLLCLV